MSVTKPAGHTVAHLCYIINFTDELVNDSAIYISSIVPVQKHLPLHVQEVDGTTRHLSPFSHSENSDKLR